MDRSARPSCRAVRTTPCVSAVGTIVPRYAGIRRYALKDPPVQGEASQTREFIFISLRSSPAITARDPRSNDASVSRPSPNVRAGSSALLAHYRVKLPTSANVSPPLHYAVGAERVGTRRIGVAILPHGESTLEGIRIFRRSIATGTRPRYFSPRLVFTRASTARTKSFRAS